MDRVSSVIDPGRMNEFFPKINTDTHHTTPVPLLIPEGTRIPTVNENSVRNIMINLKRTGPGPDGFPYWLWKDFTSYLAPVLTRILNASSEQLPSILARLLILFPTILPAVRKAKADKS